MKVYSHLVAVCIALLVGLSPYFEAQAQSVEVFDFCGLKNDPKLKGLYQKQKVLTYKIRGLKKVEAGETVLNKKGKVIGKERILAKVKGAKHFEDFQKNSGYVFLSWFWRLSTCKSLYVFLFLLKFLLFLF